MFEFEIHGDTSNKHTCLCFCIEPGSPDAYLMPRNEPQNWTSKQFNSNIFSICAHATAWCHCVCVSCIVHCALCIRSMHYFERQMCPVTLVRDWHSLARKCKHFVFCIHCCFRHPLSTLPISFFFCFNFYFDFDFFRALIFRPTVCECVCLYVFSRALNNCLMHIHE